MITKCSKNMQTSGHSQIVQLLVLNDKRICPGTAHKAIVSNRPAHKDLPLFTTSEHETTYLLTANMVRSALRKAVTKIGLSSQ